MIFVKKPRTLSQAYKDRQFDSKGLSRYKEVLQKYFEHYETLNFGISGDKTQRVLWRVTNMDLPDSLKFVIVHCGTNNVGKDGPVDIVNALFLIATHIQKRKPGIKRFVSGLLPRDRFPSKTRNIIDLINKELDLHCRNKNIQNIHFLSPGFMWTNQNGSLNASLYYTDFIHLSWKGIEKLSKLIIETIKEPQYYCNNATDITFTATADTTSTTTDITAINDVITTQTADTADTDNTSTTDNVTVTPTAHTAPTDDTSTSILTKTTTTSPTETMTTTAIQTPQPSPKQTP